jgi:hypothetical protein
MFDCRLRARADFNGVGAQDVNYDLEVSRVADLQYCASRLDDCFAFLRDLQNNTGYRCRNIPSFWHLFLTVGVLRQQGTSLIKLMFSGVQLKFCCSQIPIGNSFRQLRAL